MDNSGENYAARQNAWDEQWPDEGRARSEHPSSEPGANDELMPYPDAVGTSDPLRAVRDAEPYDAPIDPPVLPGGRYGSEVATGFGSSVEEEAVRDGYPRDDEDIREEVSAALRSDSLTSRYPLHAAVVDGVVRLTGRVPSAEDAEYAQSMLANLPGVVDVVDDTTLDIAVQ